MEEKNILKKIETQLEIQLDSPKDAKIMYNSIKPEIIFSLNDRSKSTIDINENIITINIESYDVVSLRASINSYVRWIKLSKEILDLNI